MFFRKSKESEKNIYYVNNNPILEKQVRIIKKLYKISMEKIETSLAALKMVQIFKDEYKFTNCSLFLMEKLRGSLKILATDIEDYYIDDITEFANELLENTNDIRIIHGENESSLAYKTARERNIKYSSFMIIKGKDGTLGAILLEKNNNEDVDEFQRESFQVVIETMSIALENTLLHKELLDIANRDQLTGIYNRRYMYEYIKKLTKDYSVVMIDIDFFKKFNDTYGHSAGDKVLVEVSKVIASELRKLKTGVFFRFGGEEFIIILSSMYKDRAAEISNSLREIIEKHKILYNNQNLNVTISLGVEDSSGGKHFEQIKENADQALYIAKANGRNRVEIFEADKEVL